MVHINDIEHRKFIKSKGWYQNPDYVINPSAWFHDDYPCGEERVEDVLYLIALEASK